MTVFSPRPTKSDYLVLSAVEDLYVPQFELGLRPRQSLGRIYRSSADPGQALLAKLPLSMMRTPQ
jgi:hypothetical protein